jgi:hypothetical protein
MQKEVEVLLLNNLLDLDDIVLQIENLIYCFKYNNQFHILIQHRVRLIVFMKVIKQF